MSHGPVNGLPGLSGDVQTLVGTEGERIALREAATMTGIEGKGRGLVMAARHGPAMSPQCACYAVR
jgi:hypothetical protein